MSPSNQFNNAKERDKVLILDAAGLNPSTGLNQIKQLAVLTAILIACFGKPIYALAKFALHSDLFSHILLIPFISGYLVWVDKQALPGASKPCRIWALIPALAGAAVLSLCWFGSALGLPVVKHDNLSWTALSFVLFFGAACCFTLGPRTLKSILFPLIFLGFAVPFPGFVVEAIEGGLQWASAIGADFFFNIAGMAFVRDGLFFQLPGIRLQVAPECSGIHSSLVLFITSLVAGRLFLKRFINRAFLALVVIPLGVLRNAFRILTIGELCVHVGPEMIDSPIHRRGGPLFFAISLIPLLLLIWYGRRSELRSRIEQNS
jgi:exosortase C (VPDSG-CTERM-specific)